MIDINLLYLGTFILVIVLLLLIVLLILFSNNGINEKQKKSKNQIYIPMPTTYSLNLPKNIENMTSKQIKEISKKVFASYKTFDYKNQNSSNLYKKEWHSWQISLLLMTFKKMEHLNVYNQEEIFPDFLLNSTSNDIKSFMRDIIKKYEQYVDFNKSKDELCKEYIWSNRDVSIILYFLANYKNY